MVRFGGRVDAWRASAVSRGRVAWSRRRRGRLYVKNLILMTTITAYQASGSFFQTTHPKTIRIF